MENERPVKIQSVEPDHGFAILRIIDANGWPQMISATFSHLEALRNEIDAILPRPVVKSTQEQWEDAAILVESKKDQ